ncbi:MAG: glucose/arabinose dehydrogenase [Planctomycetota bacterium]
MTLNGTFPMRRLNLLSLAGVALGLCLTSISAQTALTTELVVNGLSTPIFMTAPAGDSRLFVVEQGGRIQIIENGGELPTPFLDLSTTVSGSSEQGLLGLAFDPNYAQTGLFYVHYTTGSGSGKSVVERYSVSADPDIANAASGTPVLEVVQPYTNHNGGMLTFDRDGYLLIGFGDGGSSNDPGCRSQDLSTWLGKMLRIDVSNGLPYMIPSDNPYVGTGGAMPEIYQVGLRNPWRFSVDALTGDVVIGDVGQNANEEISFFSYGEGGVNFGWRVMESTRCNGFGNCPTGTTPACNDPAYRGPIYDLPQSTGARSITGGYVYRGSEIPDLQGTYFFADYIDSKIRTFNYDTTNGVQNFLDRTSELAPGSGLSLKSIASFGEDGFGELYICDRSGGELFKVVADQVVDVISVTPDPLDALVPGVDQVVVITGLGFSANSTVSFDGIPVDAASVTYITPQLITIDPPQATALGSASVVVTEGSESDGESITIIAPDQPKLQLGDGVVPNLVSQANGLDITVSGTPGRLHYVLYSMSNVPSVHPLVSLDIGNNFSELDTAMSFVIPVEGWTAVNLAFTAPIFSNFYSQTVAVGAGQGIEVSNLQQIVTQL